MEATTAARRVSFSGMEGSMFRGIDGLVARRTSRLSGAGTGGVGSFRARFVGDGPSSVAA